MRGSSRLAVMAAMAMAASGLPSGDVRPMTMPERYQVGQHVGGGQPYRGTAGMGHGSKVRGNLQVRRAAAKRRNQERHRRACRG